MSTTTMHFGPEWMRTKQHPPPPLVVPTQSEKSDDHNPFGYSKEEMLRIYKENTNKGGLGLEVERWEGVVRDAITEPMNLREMGEAEKKLFAGSLNSDLRRRQSVDFLSPLSTSTDRPRLNYSNSVTGSPLRERFGPLRRRDSTDSPSITAPLTRKQSVPTLQNTGIAPRDVGLPSPRSRVGLDGVSSSGDPWSARQQVSLKSAIGMSREPSGDLHEGRVNDIREDQEDDDGYGGEAKKHSDRAPDDLSAYQVNYSAAQSIGSNEMESHDLKVHANHSFENVNYDKLDRAPSGPPPGLSDLASVEWSYKDPTGQIQGPFRADLMQKWYDEGYFSFDLPTKRTHLDTHWVTVEDLLRRAGDNKIFLSVPQLTAPPGLVRAIDAPSYSGLTEQNVYKTLNQPSPIRTLRSSTLDNYVTPVSNSSDSPSSFGEAKFSNGSSDSLAIGGRAVNLSYLGEPSVSGRVANLNLTDVSAPLLARRTTLNDTALDSVMVHSQPYSPSRTASMGEYAFSGRYSSRSYTPILDPVASPRNVDPVPHNAFSQNSGLEPPLNYHNGRGGHEGVFQDNVLGDPAFNQSDYGIVDSVQRIGPLNEKPSPFNHYSNLVGAGVGQIQFPNPPILPFPSHANVHGNARTTLDPVDQHPATAVDSSSDAQVESEAAVQSPWQDVTDVSAAPVDILQSSPVSHVSPWVEGSQQLPWSYQVSAPDSWKRDRLTFSNVVQHNRQYPMNDGEVATTSAPDSSNLQEERAEVIHRLPTENACVISGDAVQPSHNQIMPQPEERRLETTLVTPDVPDKTDASAHLAAPKIAWSKEPSPSISLREIQEAEAKKAEARKGAERAIRVAPGELKEEAQAFTTSWGLPSSQAGARLPGPSKEAAPALSPSMPAPPTPVWTNAVKSSTAKKSMKEIQEEEERRKRLLSTKESTVPATARKAPAHELVNKGATNQASAWTIVGPNGKPSAPVAVSAKPPSTSAGSAVVPSSSSRMNGSAIARSVAPMKVPSSVTPKLDDFSPTPSHEFLRWLTDSLKGLNNSVNVEEIMSMLLSFPLDPDSSTVELISDLIYTNSTTLDGRRFAAEFISKRKTDARAKNAGSSSGSLSKPVSIADVVKAAPKTAQSEWAFKVVNKKKKGGRT